MPNKLSRFWQELKRRKVIHVITVYAGAAFVIIELVNNITEPLRLPEWTPALVIILLAIGFPIVIIVSWIYDVHPEGGLIKTEPADKVKPEEEHPSSNGWKIASYISFVVIVGLIVLNIFGGNRGPRLDKSLAKSIAVLPFENMSDNSEFAYLGDAMTDEIIMQLYKIHEFEVRSRTSIMQYKNNDRSSPEIGKELSVSYLMEGSVQRLKDRVRIRVQLIQANTDEHLWGDAYEGEWENIHNIIINVSKDVARQLKAVLSTDEVERIEKKPTDNIKAYDLYLLGRHFNMQESEKDLDSSIMYFRQALEIDPEFALAYYEMADSYSKYAFYGYASRSELLKAKEFALKALEIDNELAEAHVVLGYIKTELDYDWSGAEKELTRALEINPNLARAHYEYAWLLTFLKRCDEALEEWRRALELEPTSIEYRSYIGRGFYWARDYDRAIETFNQILEVTPDSEFIHAHLGLALSLKGLHKEAIEEIRKVTDRRAWYYFYRGFVFGNAGRVEEAQAELDYFIELSRKEFVWPIIFTFIYAGMGDIDKAIEWLERTYEQREGWINQIQVEPMFDNLRSDPRFQNIIDRLNFPDN